MLPVHNSVPPDTAATTGRRTCVNKGLRLGETISDDVRVLCDCALQRLFDIKGYRASAVLDWRGRPLALHVRQKKTDIEFVAKNVHDMFCSLQKRTAHLGLGELEESVFRTRDGIVLIRCMSDENQPHIHVMAIIKGAEGEGMMRIRLKRVAEEAAEYATAAVRDGTRSSSQPAQKTDPTNLSIP
jgi:hypothetical protein